MIPETNNKLKKDKRIVNKYKNGRIKCNIQTK